MAGPGAEGEKLTLIFFDCPGARLNEPPPASRENGLERLLASTLPSSVAVEVDRFVIVMDWVEFAPTRTSLKSTGFGLTSRLITGGTAVPVIDTLVGPGGLLALWVMTRVPENVVGTVTEGEENLRTTGRDFPGPKLNGPPPLNTENGLERLLVSTLPVKVPNGDKFVIVRVWVGNCPEVTLPKSTGAGATAMVIEGIPVPLTDTFVPPPEPLCVMTRVPENTVVVATGGGEKLTTTDLDCPGDKTNEPPPLTTVNGLVRLVASTFPVRLPVEVDRLVRVRIWVADLPLTTSSKLSEPGLTEALITGANPAPSNVTMVGLARLFALCVMDNVPEEDTPAVVGVKLRVTLRDCPGDRLKSPPPLITVNKLLEGVVLIVPVS